MSGWDSDNGYRDSGGEPIQKAQADHFKYGSPIPNDILFETESMVQGYSNDSQFGGAQSFFPSNYDDTATTEVKLPDPSNSGVRTMVKFGSRPREYQNAVNDNGNNKNDSHSKHSKSGGHGGHSKSSSSILDTEYRARSSKSSINDNEAKHSKHSRSTSHSKHSQHSKHSSSKYGRYGTRKHSRSRSHQKTDKSPKSQFGRAQSFFGSNYNVTTMVKYGSRPREYQIAVNDNGHKKYRGSHLKHSKSGGHGGHGTHSKHSKSKYADDKSSSSILDTEYRSRSSKSSNHEDSNKHSRSTSHSKHSSPKYGRYGTRKLSRSRSHQKPDKSAQSHKYKMIEDPKSRGSKYWAHKQCVVCGQMEPDASVVFKRYFQMLSEEGYSKPEIGDLVALYEKHKHELNQE